MYTFHQINLPFHFQYRFFYFSFLLLIYFIIGFRVYGILISRGNWLLVNGFDAEFGIFPRRGWYLQKEKRRVRANLWRHSHISNNLVVSGNFVREN